MKLLKKFLAVGLTGAMITGFTITSYANFSWKTEEGKKLGTATITQYDYQGNAYQEKAAIVEDGTLVTFTVLDYPLDFGYTHYAYDGTELSGRLSLTDQDVGPGEQFQYLVTSTANGNAVGAHRMYAVAYEENKGYHQWFVIEGKYDYNLLNNIEWVEKAEAVSNTYDWQQDHIGWWVQGADGTYLTNQWYHDLQSGRWYYLGADGYMLTNTTTPDGYYVNRDGVWVQ